MKNLRVEWMGLFIVMLLSAVSAGAAEPYRLRHGDTVMVSVWREEASADGRAGLARREHHVSAGRSGRGGRA